MSKDLVTKWFNKLPTSEQNLPLLILGGIAYSPKQTLDEVNRGSPTGDALQKLIEQGKYGTTMRDESELVKTRLRLNWQSKPQDKVLYVALSSAGSIGPKTFTPSQMIQLLDNNSPLVKPFVNNEASYMQRLVQVR